MKALLISRDTQLYAEIASQGAARVPPLNVAASRASLRDALDRPLVEAPGLVIVDTSEADVADGDLLANVRQRHRRLLVGDVQRGVAKLAVQVDQQHLFVGQRGQGVAEIGREEGRAAAALAGDEGEDLTVAHRGHAGAGGDAVDRFMQGAVHQRQLQHLAHPGTHRADQELRVVIVSQQHEMR